MTYRVNAGRLPRSHWTHDPDVGGGRIVGEACHFVDTCAFLAGAPPVDVRGFAVGGGSEPREDDVTALVRFADGSIATIVYAAFGDASLPKERLEVLGEAGAGVLDDFRRLTLHRAGRETVREGRRDKGHAAELAAWAEACRTGRQPWPVADMAAVMRATFAIRDAVRG
jgi:predicted dehydrogenase